MLIGADYPFLDLVWTMIIIFAWVIWFWMLISIAGDLFRRHDISGAKKALWLVAFVALPYLGALLYLIANGDGMAKRSIRQAEQQQSQVDAYIRQVAHGGVAEIERAKALLDAGTITQPEFEQLKAKALAS